LFRHLLVQIGGAKIENPPPSSSLQRNLRLRSLRAHRSLRSLRLALRAAARDSRRSRLGAYSSFMLEKWS
jgi:hypothetical protein